MLGCAAFDAREEELESRILSGIRELLVRESVEMGSRMYFVYELLESLLRYEKDEEDFRKIESAVINIYNPAHIGRIFYNKLRETENQVEY